MENAKFSNKSDIWGIVSEMITGKKRFSSDYATWKELHDGKSGEKPSQENPVVLFFLTNDLLNVVPSKRPSAERFRKILSCMKFVSSIQTTYENQGLDIRLIAFHLASAIWRKDIMDEVINELTKYPEWWVDRFQLEVWAMNVQFELGLAVDHYRKHISRHQAIAHSAASGYEKTLQHLLSLIDRRTCFLWAVKNGHLEVTKFLVKEAGAEVESKDDVGRTPLSRAAYNGHLDIVKFLVQKGGADVESKSNSGQTPLSCAASNSHLEIVKFLVKEGGADVESKDKEGQTALDLASRGPREGWSFGDPEGRKAVAAWLKEEKKTRRKYGG